MCCVIESTLYWWLAAMPHCLIQYYSHELLFPPAFPNISSSRAIFKSSHYCSGYNPRCIVPTHCVLSEFIVVPVLEQRSPSSRGYFIVSPVIRFPRVRNHRGVPRYRWSRSGTERDKGRRARRWGESGGVARKRNRTRWSVRSTRQPENPIAIELSVRE